MQNDINLCFLINSKFGIFDTCYMEYHWQTSLHYFIFCFEIFRRFHKKFAVLHLIFQSGILKYIMKLILYFMSYHFSYCLKMFRTIPLICVVDCVDDNSFHSISIRMNVLFTLLTWSLFSPFNYIQNKFIVIYNAFLWSHPSGMTYKMAKSPHTNMNKKGKKS